MKLKEIKIRTLLALGTGVIFVLIVILGFLSWRQNELLWLQTEKMYNSSLQLRRTMGDIQAGILEIFSKWKDLVLVKDQSELFPIIQDIEARHTDFNRFFAILYNLYNGPQKDVILLHENLSKWLVIKEKALRLLREGKTTEAEVLVKAGGEGDVQAQTLMAHILKMDELLRNKADQFYQDAKKSHRRLNQQLFFVAGIILLVSMTTSFVLMKHINDPLQELAAVQDQFRQGKLDVRSTYVSSNEIGILSKSFNTLADTIETEMRLNEQAAHLTGIMLREIDARVFSLEVLKVLMRQTNSQIGAIYLLNSHKTAFEHFESIGLSNRRPSSLSAIGREGEFGIAMTTGQMERITEIPEDSRFTFVAVGGEFKLKEVFTIPIVSNHETLAIISLGSIYPYRPEVVRLLQEVFPTLTMRMVGVLAYRQLQELAGRLEQQNQILENQKQELAAQAAKLMEMNAELEMQKKQVDEANRLKSVFFSKMSHELRTPLNSVITLSDILSRHLKGKISEEDFSYLGVIERNGRQLLGIINDILDFSRLEAGREEIRLAPFSLRAIVDDIVAMLKPQAQEKEIKLVNEVCNELPIITSDPDKVRHILQNLVGNAVKFTETGSVKISAEQRDEEIHVKISDTGIGIAVDQLSYIFNEFRQGDDSTSRKYGGSGLGLSIARKYANMLGGDIQVESIPGKGSTFTLTLPITLSLTG